MHYCMGMPALLLCRNALTVVLVLQMPKEATPEQRRDAVVCYHSNNEDIRAATKQFSSMHPGAIKKVSDFIRYNLSKVHGTNSFHNRPRSGRKPKVSRAQAVRAAKLLKAGHRAGSTTVQFTSMQQAERLSPQLRQIRQDAKCTPRCLRKAMMQHDRDLSFSMQRCKIQLTLQQKQARKAYCRTMLKWGLKKLLSMVWIDAKKICMQPPARLRVYGSKASSPSTISDSRVPRGGRQTKSLYYYSAVSPLVGPVKIITCTGTTGYDSSYKVSVCMPGSAQVHLWSECV
jgi:hypothetical protein